VGKSRKYQILCHEIEPNPSKDAIYWFSNSWKETETSTIAKCFAKAGFVTTPAPVETDNDVDEADDDVPLAALKLSRELFGVEFSELRMMDLRTE
jgi:hypothetical protein